MNQLELSSDEEAVLHDLITHRLAELEVEILHTDHSAFRDLLKHRREVLTRLAERLSHSHETADAQ